MSHTRSPIFTDVIKDVIGDHPVLDQFDIDYYASFYGGMQDDYVTGSMLTKKVKNGGGYSFVTGTRGVSFSKTYASEATANIESVVGNYSTLSKRLVPLEDITSKTSYRTTQCVDQEERFYDSCLPNLNQCFEADGSKVWTVNNAGGSAGFLSPENMVVTSSVGYMFFNSQLNDGIEMSSNKVLTNNKWTWSYPYENKYSPRTRFASLRDALGSIETNLTTTWKSSTTIDPFKTVSLTNTKTIRNFFPILQGHLDVGDLAPGGRNAMKLPLVDFENQEVYSPLPLTASIDSRGMSWLLPADVDVYTFATSSLSNSDMTKFLFGFGDINNMTHTSLKFVDPGSGSAYTESFSSPASVGEYWQTGPGVITNNAAGFKLDWTQQLRNNNALDAGPMYHLPWFIARGEGTIEDKTLPYTGEVNAPYRYQYIISGSKTTPAGAPYDYLIGKAGIYWAWSGTSTNQVLMSDSNLFGYSQKDYSPNLIGDSDYFTMSTAVVDITCSHDWSFSYNRAVSCDKSDALFVWLSSFPDGLYPSRSAVPIDFLTGSGNIASSSNTGLTPGYEVGVMRKFSLLEHDTHKNIPLSKSIKTHFENRQSLENFSLSSWPECEKRNYPLPSGSYRLVFSYLKSGSTLGVSIPNNYSLVDRAAIDLFRIYTFPNKEECYLIDENSPVIGANNYPEFRKTFVDSRMTNSDYYDASPTNLTGSIFTNSSRNFGVSPIIRGWKYGLYSGFPAYTKAVFRNRRFGQLRDMLEQRQYGKFLKVAPSSDGFENPSINSIDANSTQAKNPIPTKSIDSSPVSVKFVKRQYVKDDRNIGTVYNTSVDSVYTTSQNLSNESTSSVPYADGIARNRSEESYNQVIDMSTKWTGPVRKLTREY